MTSEATVQATYRRYWRCAVYRKTTHDHCAPGRPHTSEWGCGYRWIAPILSDEDIEKMTDPAGAALQQSFDRRSS